MAKGGFPDARKILVGTDDETPATSKTGERDNFTETVRKKTFDKQDGHCYDCHRKVKSSHMEYHHRNFDRTNGTSDNCIGLCHDCHKDRHDEQRIKESDKKKKTKKKEKPRPIWDPGIRL